MDSLIHRAPRETKCPGHDSIFLCLLFVQITPMPLTRIRPQRLPLRVVATEAAHWGSVRVQMTNQKALNCSFRWVVIAIAWLERCKHEPLPGRTDTRRCWHAKQKHAWTQSFDISIWPDRVCVCVSVLWEGGRKDANGSCGNSSSSNDTSEK